MSPTVENRFADHAWCPAPARPMMIAGHHAENCPIGCAKSAKSGKNAKMSIESIRPLYGCMPFFSTKNFGRYPPKMDMMVTIA